VQADYLTYHDGTLFVGEFYRKSTHITNPYHHLSNSKGKNFKAWMVGYRNGQLDAILATRGKVQGAAFHGDKIYLSISYGRKKPSRIGVYKNPLLGPPSSMVIIQPNDRKIGVWFLDRSVHLGTIPFPPMSEGITVADVFVFEKACF
jgi:hypothetical protein